MLNYQRVTINVFFAGASRGVARCVKQYALASTQQITGQIAAAPPRLQQQ